MGLFCIPSALQIDLDDMGWFCGRDDRKAGGPSRTGIPRRHVPADYLAVNELGRRLNMRINCGLVIGEWDADNSLGAIPHLSPYGQWNNAAYYDAEGVGACVDALNASGYINPCIHGLMHGYYSPLADWHDTSDFYYRVKNELKMLPEDEVRARLDAFLHLLGSNGVKLRLHSFIPPSFAYRWDELSRILWEYGVRYVGTIFGTMDKNGASLEGSIGIEPCGMVTYDRHNNPIPWDAFGGWDDLPPMTGLIGVHWPNLLHKDPERNTESVDAAERYLRRMTENFGTILSRGVEFYTSQALYKRYAVTAENDGVMTVDLSGLPRTPALADRFYISARRPITAISGCTATVYEGAEGFITYEVIPTAGLLTVAAES